MATFVVAQEMVHRQVMMPDFSLLFLVVVALGLMVIAYRLGVRTLAVVLAGGLLVCFVWGFRSSPVGRPVASSVTRQGIPADHDQGSTEAMWEHLSRPRIVLEADGKPRSERAVVVNNQEVKNQREDADQLELSQHESMEQQRRVSPPRPTWVDNPPKRVGNVYRVVVSSGGYKTEEECYRSLEPQLGEVVQRRIEQLVPGGASPESAAASISGSIPESIPDWIPELGQLDIGLDSVWRDICTESWVEKSEASFGQMQQVHVLMEFASAQDERLKQAYRRFQRSDRIAGLGTAAGAVVAGLMLLYGLLKADNATRGYYSKRLFFGVPAVIIGLVLLFLA